MARAKPKTEKTPSDDIHIKCYNGADTGVDNVTKGEWTERVKSLFLDHLAASCNVTHSAEKAGKKPHHAYSLRRRDAEFARRWDKALEVGYAGIEAMLLERAKSGIENGEENPSNSKNISAEFAMKLLGEHRKLMASLKKSEPDVQAVASEEETNAAIIKRLRVLKNRIDKKGGG